MQLGTRALARTHLAEWIGNMSNALATYGTLHTQANDTVTAHANRSVSVTTGRTVSGWYVLSALASKASGDMVRVVIALDGERLDAETGTIADSLYNALILIPETDRVKYARAWRDVFIPGSHDVIK